MSDLILAGLRRTLRLPESNEGLLFVDGFVARLGDLGHYPNVTFTLEPLDRLQQTLSLIVRVGVHHSPWVDVQGAFNVADLESCQQAALNFEAALP